MSKNMQRIAAEAQAMLDRFDSVTVAEVRAHSDAIIAAGSAELASNVSAAGGFLGLFGSGAGRSAEIIARAAAVPGCVEAKTAAHHLRRILALAKGAES